METSYFMDLTTPPDNQNLKIAIGNLFTDWMTIRDFTFEKYPLAKLQSACRYREKSQS